MGELTGRIALITGGGRGIGRATAARLARSGAVVAVVARSRDEVQATAVSINEAHGTAHAFAFDLAQHEELAKCAQAIKSQLGTVDILINNAGVIGPSRPLASTDCDEWVAALGINLLAPVRLTCELLPAMIERGWGRIVNVSTGAVRNPAGGGTLNAYVSSKTALEAHSLNLAAQLHSTGVTVNVLRPGVVDTPMQADLRERDPEELGTTRFREHALRGSLLDADVPAARVVELVTSSRNGQIEAITN